MSHADEEFLDVVLDASAQSGWGGRWIIQEGTTDGHQASFQGQLGSAPLLRCGVGEGFGLAVELVDGVSPLSQPVIVGVEVAQVVDVPQQMGPAALLGTAIGQGLG